VKYHIRLGMYVRTLTVASLMALPCRTFASLDWHFVGPLMPGDFAPSSRPLPQCQVLLLMPAERTGRRRQRHTPGALAAGGGGAGGGSLSSRRLLPVAATRRAQSIAARRRVPSRCFFAAACVLWVLPGPKKRPKKRATGAREGRVRVFSGARCAAWPVAKAPPPKKK
jgi:hypothetical protein